MGLSTDRRALLFKRQPTFDVDAAPTAAADSVLFADMRFTPLEIKYAERKFIRAGYGGFPKKAATKWGKIEIDVEMAGFGTAGPATPTASLDAMLQCVGLAGVLTAGTKWDYSPISNGFAMGTCWAYEDGRLHKLINCRGNLKANAKAEEIGLFTFEFWGAFQPVVDAAMIVPVVAAYQDPVPFAKDFVTLAALLGAPAGVCLESWSFDLGNTVIPPNGRVNCAQSIEITGRASTGQIVVEGTTVATKDWFGIVTASQSNNTIDFTLGTVAGNRLGFSSSHLQVEPPSLGEEDKLELLTLPCTYNPVTPGDELKFTFS